MSCYLKSRKLPFKLKKNEAAKNYSHELLQLAKNYPEDWNYGNAIHDGNMVLGLVALEEKKVSVAKKYLLKAGNAPTSPQISSFGPSMLLASEMIKIDEKEVVIDYLELIKKIWVNNDGQLNSLIAAIKGGGKPFFKYHLK